MISVSFITNDQIQLKPIKEKIIEKFNYIEDIDSNFKINLNFNIRKLDINFNGLHETKTNLPISLKDIFNLFDQCNNLISIKVSNLIYFPYKSLIVKYDNKLNLTEIHNKIFLHLSLYPEGVKKDLLYKKIWPNDKDFNINKLDTHLTNLKKILEKNFNFNLTFSSRGGNLVLI